MFKFLKILFYALLVLSIAFLFWFLPKYSIIQKNPGFCSKLTDHLYYCGNEGRLDKLLNSGK